MQFEEMVKGELHKLNRAFDATEIEFKPGAAYYMNNQAFVILQPYKTARTDMDILDEVCGVGEWQNKYQRDTNGMLQCGIGVYVDELQQWVWKWSNGTPSHYEKEKGEYSDAFKRAGYMWGIGRPLYDFPTVRVALNDNEYTEDGNKIKVSQWFKPNEWKWSLHWGDDELGFKLVGEQRRKVEQEWKWVTRYDSNPYDSKKPNKR